MYAYVYIYACIDRIYIMIYIYIYNIYDRVYTIVLLYMCIRVHLLTDEEEDLSAYCLLQLCQSKSVS